MEALARIYEFLRQSRALEAERLLAQLLQESPNEPGVHRARAALAQSAGRMDVAVEAMVRAVELAPFDATLRMELGQTQAAAGQIDAAIASFSRAAEFQPEHVGAWYLLGMTLYGARRDADALPALRRAHALAPAHPQIALALAETEYLLEHHTKALPLFERIAAANPDDPRLWLRRSQCRRRLGAPEQALALVKEAIARFPEEATLWLELGWVQEDLGDAQEAQGAYARAHALRPDWADPVGSAITLARGKASEVMLQDADLLLANPAVSEQQKAYLHHALGKHDDSRGEHASAAAHWASANALRRALDGPFDRDNFTAQIEAAIAAFTPELLQRRQATALRDERPVFVVGMPRSGTTLVEQVLAAHPAVHGCGERTGIVEIASAIEHETGLRWPADAARIPDPWLQAKATAYLESGAPGSSDIRRVVDKQPYNFLHVGLLSMLFADARIVWCRRDPRDIALSIFSESFSPMSAYATDLDDIRFMIEGQVRLMRHWQAVSPLPILEMRYEDMVADTEQQARRLIDFAGLPWDDACLAFHESARPVQTLSRWQVRQPVHNRSVGRWRNYPQWFGSEE
jgi:tetratricopeptide (TPR) repeat protein